MIISFYFRNPFPILVKVTRICAPVLLYYITAGLFFFSSSPLVTQKYFVIFLLLAIIAIQFYSAIKHDSQLLASTAILMLATTAIISENSNLFFVIITITAICSLYLFFKNSWWKLLLYSLFLVYIFHLIWIFNNPIVGNRLKIVDDPQNNIIFILTYGIIYSLSILIPRNKLESNAVLLSVSLWNFMFISLLTGINTLSFYKDTYAPIFAIITSLYLIFAVVLKIKSSRKFAPATYACFGYLALSISIYGYVGLPDAYLMLVLQSFLVVSMALWFHSKIIVVANSFLFVIILLVYIFFADSLNQVNFAFAITALATARILNWQKERLTLKTDTIRNVYLIIAFAMVLYSIKQSIPANYLILGWTFAAIVFLVFSIILHNIKYRYLAIITIVVTGGHLFFIDLGQLEIGYRVIAFFVFATISLGISLYYTKRFHKK